MLRRYVCEFKVTTWIFFFFLQEAVSLEYYFVSSLCEYPSPRKQHIIVESNMFFTHTPKTQPNCGNISLPPPQTLSMAFMMGFVSR